MFWPLMPWSRLELGVTRCQGSQSNLPFWKNVMSVNTNIRASSREYLMHINKLDLDLHAKKVVTLFRYNPKIETNFMSVKGQTHGSIVFHIVVCHQNQKWMTMKTDIFFVLKPPLCNLCPKYLCTLSVLKC